MFKNQLKVFDVNLEIRPINLKGDSQFSSHMKEKTDAMSTFSATKTITEQRRYLPAFAVREELLQIIRDNQSSLF